jgi:hypothetical protein
MSKIPLASALLSLLALAALAGCSHKTDAKTELENAAGVLAATDAPSPASTPEPAPSEAQAATAALASSPDLATAPPATPARQMQQALASYKAGELEDAVTRLQKLRTTTVLTAQQRMAVQDSVAAVMTEIYELASKGDTKAIQAVKQYEEMQTSRH